MVTHHGDLHESSTADLGETFREILVALSPEFEAFWGEREELDVATKSATDVPKHVHRQFGKLCLLHCRADDENFLER